MIRKLTLDSRSVFRKRRLHFNAEVSGWNDEFSCEGEAEVVRNRGRSIIDRLDDILNNKEPKARSGDRYGVSLMEFAVSDYGTVNMMRGAVGI